MEAASWQCMAMQPLPMGWPDIVHFSKCVLGVALAARQNAMTASENYVEKVLREAQAENSKRHLPRI